MIKNQKTLISRGRVRVVQTSTGGIYEIVNGIYKLRVNIEQPEKINSGLSTSSVIKRTYFDTDNIDFKEGEFLPGNIYIKYVTTPITDDPEEHLLWVNGKVKRTFERNPIYFFHYYVPDIQYQPLGEIDPPIPISG